MKVERGVYSAELTPEQPLDPVVTVALKGPLSAFKELVDYVSGSTEEQVPYHLYTVLEQVVKNRVIPSPK